MFVLEATVSGILFAILALLTGAVMTASYILPGGEPAEIRRELLLFAFVLLLAFLLVACISLVVQGVKLEGGHLPSSDTVGRYVLRTQSGKTWLVREIYALLLTAAILWALQSKNKKAAAGLFLFSLPLVASRSLMSHAAAVKEPVPVALAADAIHLIASALWGGALPVLFGVLYYGTKRLKLPLTWAAGVVSRFSRVALGSVAMLILTGLYQSLIHVGDLHTLLETPYGNVLLSKLFLVFVMLGLGLLNFFSTRRRLLKQAQRGNDPHVIPKALTRIGAESFLGLLVFSVTGFLTTLPPGIHAQHQRSAATTHHHPTLKRAPAQGASVQILSPKPGELFQGDQVRLQYKLTKGKRGHHVHAYVDGKLMGMFASESGTLTGISKGQHVLELRVVAEDHQTELDASDRVPFVVK